MYVLEVDKVCAAQEQAQVLQFLEVHVQIVRALGHMREQAGAVVEIGIVAVDGVARTAISNANVTGLRSRCAEGGSVAQRRVEVALNHVVLEFHRLGRHSHCGNCGQCQAAH